MKRPWSTGTTTSWLSGGIKVGDRVRIRPPISRLEHRKNRNGIVTHVDGAYIMVQPTWCSWKVELYPNELEVLQ